MNSMRDYQNSNQPQSEPPRESSSSAVMQSLQVVAARLGEIGARMENQFATIAIQVPPLTTGIGSGPIPARPQRAEYFANIERQCDDMNATMDRMLNLLDRIELP